MERITEEESIRAAVFVPCEAMGAYWKKDIHDRYMKQNRRDLSRGIIVSSLVALTLIGGILIGDILTPKDVKYERQVRVEQMAKEMPYGIR